LINEDAQNQDQHRNDPSGQAAKLDKHVGDIGAETPQRIGRFGRRIGLGVRRGIGNVVVEQRQGQPGGQDDQEESGDFRTFARSSSRARFSFRHRLSLYFHQNRNDDRAAADPLGKQAPDHLGHFTPRRRFIEGLMLLQQLHLVQHGQLDLLHQFGVFRFVNQTLALKVRT